MSKNCIKRPSIIYEGITWTLGLGLVSANDSWWKRHRKVMDKAFSHKNLSSFVPLFNKEVNHIIENIERNLKQGENIELMKLFEKLTLKIASGTILKKELDPKNLDKMLEYTTRMEEYVTEAIIKINYKIYFIFKLGQFTTFRKGVEGVTFLKKLINESWYNLKENNNGDYPEMNSALDYVLKGVNDNVLKEDEICNSILHLFFGAFDTIASTSFYVLVFLAMYPQYQERLYEEISSLKPDNDDHDLTWEELNKFSYLEMVLNETMRLTPAVPHIAREVCNENLTLNNDVTIPVGQCMFIDIFGLHRSKEIWGPNANIFNPDNFLPSNTASRDPFAFIPFTKGLRFCIGGKYAMIFLKVYLIKILRRYKFTTDFKYEDLKFVNHTIMKFVEKPKLHLQRRDVR
ncbi:putative cytochrome P450 313a4 [Cochliomyia hominivorax]